MSETLYYTSGALLLGVLLDTLLGDPERLPHPIRFFGTAISFCERLLNKGMHKKLKGFCMGTILVFATGAAFWGVQHLLGPSPAALCLFGGIFIFYGISNRSLIEEALKVESKVQKEDIEGARKQLSRIVGRDTTHLTPQQIRIAVLETLSENLSDGVVAPLFYYAVGGIPLMMAYKMINTLDSMVAYKNERFADFGWFCAKLDDVANYIPARLTALIMVLFPPNINAAAFVRRYGQHHASPNSGYPESALAGLLNCRFGGPNHYHGKVVDKPYIGDNDRELCHKDIIKACLVNARTFAIVCIMLLFM